MRPAFVVAWAQSVLRSAHVGLLTKARWTKKHEQAQAIPILAEVTVLQPRPDYLV